MEETRVDEKIRSFPEINPVTEFSSFIAMKVLFNDLQAHHRSIQSELDSTIADVIARSAFIRGPFVDQFEADYRATMGVRHVVSCANGTDAIYITLRGLNLKPGDEVITTAHSWIATSETITQAGARVVFCDTDNDTFTLNPRLLEAKITPATRAIIVVHLFGQPADMDPILAIAARHGIPVIEDCAQAHMATCRGRLVGTMGLAGTFSFYPGKNLGAMGDAGCLVTNDDQLARFTAMFARHGGLNKGDHEIEGINSRMDGLQAAILSVKLRHLRKWTDARQRIARRYDSLLNGVGDIVTPKVAPDRTHVYHLYVIRTEKRDALREYLKNRQIDTVLNYPTALPFLKAYAYLKHSPEDFPVAFAHQSRILSLPIYPEMPDEATVHVTEAIKDFFAGKQ